MKAGERYKIMNTKISGRVFEEGIATLIEPCEVDGQWVVAFDGDDGQTVTRFVDPVNYVR